MLLKTETLESETPASPAPLRETILLINQFFYPDSAATSQYLTDLARSLGPNATAISGSPDYAGGEATEVGPPPPTTIIRTTNRPFARGTLNRLASYATFYISAARTALKQNPDIVLTLTTPPFIALIGTALKKLKGARHVIWEMDVYPDIALDLGTTKLLKTTRPLANYIHRNADAIIVLGECMKQRLLAHGVPAHKLHIAQNWADGTEIQPLEFPKPGEPITIHYSGNLGLAHDVATIRDAIPVLQNTHKFIFAGGGKLRKELENTEGITFQPYCPRADLGKELAKGHIGLVTMNPKAIGSVVPSKLYGIMAAGRPVLFIGPKGSEPAITIEKFNCGWQINPGETQNLIDLLKTVTIEEIKTKGKAARSAFETNFDRPIGIARILKILT